MPCALPSVPCAPSRLPIIDLPPLPALPPYPQPHSHAPTKRFLLVLAFDIPRTSQVLFQFSFPSPYIANAACCTSTGPMLAALLASPRTIKLLLACIDNNSHDTILLPNYTKLLFVMSWCSLYWVTNKHMSTAWPMSSLSSSFNPRIKNQIHRLQRRRDHLKSCERLSAVHALAPQVYPLSLCLYRCRPRACQAASAAAKERAVSPPYFLVITQDPSLPLPSSPPVPRRARPRPFLLASSSSLLLFWIHSSTPT